MYIRKIILFFILLSWPIMMSAEDKLDRAWWRHEIRVGWGDQLFETAMWHDVPFVPVITSSVGYDDFDPSKYRAYRKEDYKYFQHLFVEYQYRFNSWFSMGLLTDLSGFSWSPVVRDGKGREVARGDRAYCYNLVLVPSFRFTYFHHPYVNIYSGIGLGVGINGGTEKNIRGQQTVCGMALNLTAVGLSANYSRYFAAVEFGGLYSIQNKDAIFMAGSRMFTASIGARF